MSTLKLARPFRGASLAFCLLAGIAQTQAQTNQPPQIHLTTPFNGTTFTAPANINICAEAVDHDGHVVLVEYFANTNKIGFRTNFNAGALPCIVWSNVPPGSYVLTAQATDNGGATALSLPVSVTVRPPPDLPTVSIKSTHNTAEGSTNAGVFTVSRVGGTNVNADVKVYYSIGGTASNGVDYATISDSVTIPGGVSSAKINIVAIDDSIVEPTELVVLTLKTNAAYLLADSRIATVLIEDNDHMTNTHPPLIHITTPTNGSVFTTPVDIKIAAEVNFFSNTVVGVDFFANDHLVGHDIGTNKPLYSVIWSNAQRGFYMLTAVARTANTIGAVSDPVHITINGTNPPPPTNAIVTIFASDPVAAEGTNFLHWGVTNHICTNCPPRTNTATFTIRRTGATNNPLTVTYAIGGTASNGVDYLTIPNSVTIPPGEHSARVTIVPIDDTIVEPTETVILELVQGTNVPPPYIVGWPGRAAAIIVDNDTPPPTTGSLKDGTFHMSLPAPEGMLYLIESSEDLVNWLPVGTSTTSDIGVHFADPDSQTFAQRFYRVKPLGGTISVGIPDMPANK